MTESPKFSILPAIILCLTGGASLWLESSYSGEGWMPREGLFYIYGAAYLMCGVGYYLFEKWQIHFARIGILTTAVAVYSASGFDVSALAAYFVLVLAFGATSIHRRKVGD
jgi:hypothetical protein